MSKYKFELYLEENKIQEAELSTSLRKKANDIRKVKAGIDETKVKIVAGNLSVKKKEALQQEIADAEQALPELDNGLVAAITKWIPRRADFAAAGERLKGGKKAGQAQQTVDTRTAPAAKPEGTKVQPPATTNHP